MKKYGLFKLLLAGAVLPAIVSCDNIDENERLIEMDKIIPSRAVLIEEFTGQACQNCPVGHRSLESMVSLYSPEYVIPVSIHASGLSVPESRGGLAVADGTVYWQNAGRPDLPAALFNRVGTPVNDPLTWQSPLALQLVRMPKTDITVTATPASDAEGNDGKVNIKVNLRPLENVEGHLQLWVVESGLVAVQRDGESVVNNYVHNHVFRGAVNGTEGDAISLKAGEPVDFEYTLTMSDKWNPDNIGIVGFVYDADGVANAAHASLAGK